MNYYKKLFFYYCRKVRRFTLRVVTLGRWSPKCPPGEPFLLWHIREYGKPAKPGQFPWIEDMPIPDKTKDGRFIFAPCCDGGEYVLYDPETGETERVNELPEIS